ncbi:MAG TPA: carboxypeptidase regulatory-like domain-containing protein, partial [Candidatus Acidoferrales bacterium]|nr:carboxypeptidase regulatory-like domain-containing protein [Candidatus Acidoferrales bacterium]
MHVTRSSSVRLLLLALVLVVPAISRAQTATTGDLAGTVMDPSGAAVPNATVTITSVEKGTTLSAKTSPTGFYRFQLLPPGQYDMKVEAQGFQAFDRRVSVSVNQITTSDVHMSVGTENVTVRVTEAAPLLNTENGSISTTLSQTQVQNMPNPGNDLTFAAQITPGVVMNSLGGFANFAVNGISGTANLFTLDGMDSNDPYLSLNNSGATNLMLGLNEVQEVTVDQNGYTGQYNSLAGSNINYVTRSGTNQFHGRAVYYWNGRAMNANSWFNNATDTPRSFVNANQWGGDFSGPVFKDKLWFYFDTEGLRVLLPTSTLTIVPSPQFEAATLANLSSTGKAASVPFYQNMFNLFNGAPGIERAVPGNGSQDTTGCGGIAFPGLGAAPCTLNFRSNVNNITSETSYAGRLDWNISNADRIYGRIQTDHGQQATFTDPINSLFNLTSTQPEWQGQLNWTHTFSPTMTNQLILSGQWYSAIFTAPNLPAALAAFPTTLSMADGSLTTLGGLNFLAPQGRNITQVQISDDMSKVAGRQTFKWGVKYRLNYATDFVYGILTSGLVTVPDLTSFFNGGTTSTGDNAVLTQNFPTAPSQRFKFYTLGGYLEDDIRVSPKFTLTVALRVEHQSNPTCKNNCFSRTPETFNLVSNDPVLSSPDTPYNQLFVTGQRTALPSLQQLQWQPRISFAWSPRGGGPRATVVRAGFGVFYDTFPGTIVDDFSENPPLLQAFNTTGAISPAEPSNIFATAANSNLAFTRGFINGASFNTLAATVPGFAAPAVFVNQNHTEIPQYLKYSLEIQQGLDSKTSFDIRYVGNRGIHETVQIPSLNAFQPPSGFAGLPVA